MNAAEQVAIGVAEGKIPLSRQWAWRRVFESEPELAADALARQEPDAELAGANHWLARHQRRELA